MRFVGNHIIPYLILVVILTNCSPSPSNEANNEESIVADSDLTACQRYDEVDLKMLNTIKQINSEYQNDEKFLYALKEAQIYWIQYRNRQAKAVFTLQPKQYDYPVGECKCELYTELTLIRIKELERWLKGVSPDEDCPGSYKVVNQ